MPRPGEHKTLEARILKYAQEIGWTYVSHDKAELRRGFDSAGTTPEDRARNRSLFFGDLLLSPITAPLRGYALELPELKWFLADDAR